MFRLGFYTDFNSFIKSVFIFLCFFKSYSKLNMISYTLVSRYSKLFSKLSLLLLFKSLILLLMFLMLSV